MNGGRSGACASHKAGFIPVKNTNEYMNYQKQEDVEIAADLYANELKTKEGFYLNVNEKNFYPVNLIVRNNSEGRLFLLKADVRIVDSVGNQYFPTSCSVMSGEFERSKIAYALLGFGIFSYLSADEANKRMETDRREKELANDLVISPGQRASGFVYFKMPEGFKPNGMILKVKLESPETKKTHSFDLQL